MYMQAEKSKNDRNEAIINSASQKRNGSRSNFRFVDNRSAAIVQEKMKVMASNSLLATQSKSLQHMIGNCSMTKQTIESQGTEIDSIAHFVQNKDQGSFNEGDKNESGVLNNDLMDQIETDAKRDVKLGAELHHVELKMIGERINVGIASEWTNIQHIVSTLISAAGEAGSEIEGRQAEIQAIFAPVKNADDLANKLQSKLNKLHGKMRETRPPVRATSSKEEKEKVAFDKLKEKWADVRHNLTVALADLTMAAKAAIQAAWEQFGDFLPAHLVPAGAVFKDRDPFGDAAKYKYHTGEIGDPIPIMWYKAPCDYPAINYRGKQYKYTEAVKIGGANFGLAAENNPAEQGFKLQKIAHNESRQGQKLFNELFNENDVKVGAKNAPALGEKGGYDGDHVKDLGFGGKDQADNYWPLDAEINRRAFNGYNSRYIISYLDADANEMKARAIGGLIGKHFKVKGFYNGIVPDESGTSKAGTDSI